MSAALAAAYLVVAPASTDLAAHVYRADLFSREGFALWNGQWYAGHHVPAYSVLLPALASVLGPRLAGALAAVAGAGLFAVLARGHFGSRARLGILWFAAGSATLLLSGRLPFALGVAIGLGALVAAQRERRWLALALAGLTTLASPVAGAFLALAATAWALGSRRALGAGIAAIALATGLLLAVAFPEGGTAPFVLGSFWPIPVFAGAALAVVPRAERSVRVGLALYALVSIAAFAVANPFGVNAVRLGALFGGPVLACALWRRRPVALALVAIPLLVWQWSAAIRDVVVAQGDPAVRASYYAPLVGFLERRRGPPGRLEIPFTRTHWEVAYLAPRFALARGGERQLDLRDNPLFYRPGLTAATYRAWLDELAVRYVALPDAALDRSAVAEATLVAGGLDYLRPVWSNRHWRVFAVRRPASLADGPGRVSAMGVDSFTIRARAHGALRVRVRYTPYWALADGAGCVGPGPGDWTTVRVAHAERVRVVIRFALDRIGARSARCRDDRAS